MSKYDFSTKDGRNTYNREWAKAHRGRVKKWARAYYLRHKEKVKADARAYDARKREEMRRDRIFSKHSWGAIKERALERGLEFIIDREDYPIPEVCPALGLVLDWSDRNHTPSLDRIDNDKGYVLGNVVVISNKANTVKSNLSISDLKRLTDFYVNTYS